MRNFSPKNIGWIALTMIICALFASGCSKTNEPAQVATPSITPTPITQSISFPTSEAQMREIAWSSLSDSQRKTINIDWAKAKVASIRGESLHDRISMDDAENQIPDHVVQVTFHTTQDAVLGPLIVYINEDTQQRIGISVRK